MAKPIIIDDISKRLPLSGGTLTGSYLGLKNGYSGLEGNEAYAEITSRKVQNDGTNHRSLRVSSGSENKKDSVNLIDYVNGSGVAYRIYGQHNKPEPQEINAFPYEVLSSTLNPNNISKSGFVTVKTTPNENLPMSTDHGMLLSNFDVGTDFQLWFPDGRMQIWKRFFNNSEKVWGAWSNTWDINALKDGAGNTITSTYLPLSGGIITGDLQVNGCFKIGSNVNGHTNYIAFYGTSGDNPGSFNHTYIGENIWAEPEGSELVLFKGNDHSQSATVYQGSGPDRIRHIASAHLFQIYTTALSGSFQGICDSTVPENVFELNRYGAKVYGTLDITGVFSLPNGTWNKAGDDAYFGDNNTAGSFAIKGMNGTTNLKMVQYGDNNTASGTLAWNGTQFNFSHNLFLPTDKTDYSANRARNISAGTSGSPVGNGDMFVKY